MIKTGKLFFGPVDERNGRGTEVERSADLDQGFQRDADLRGPDEPAGTQKPMGQGRDLFGIFTLDRGTQLFDALSALMEINGNDFFNRSFVVVGGGT